MIYLGNSQYPIFYNYVYLDKTKPGLYNYFNDINYIVFNHEPFYVGKGRGGRAEDVKGHICSTNRLLSGRIKKLTSKNISIVKLEFLIFEDLAYKREEELVSMIGRIDLKTGPLCNLSSGGRGGTSHSAETRLKISQANKGKKVSEETKEKLRLANIGKTNSLESNLKRSKTLMGHQNTPKGSENWNFNKKWTDEERKAMSIIKKNNPTKYWLGKERSQETKDKISKKSKNMPKSEEFKLQVSKTLKEKYASGEIAAWHKDKKMPQSYMDKMKGKFIGIKSCMAKFTKEQVIEIKINCKTPEDIKFYSKKYQVHITSIYNILKGLTYRDISIEENNAISASN